MSSLFNRILMTHTTARSLSLKKVNEEHLIRFFDTDYSINCSQVNLPACSPHCFFNAERQAGKLCIPILKSLV